jgi:hypothetical protein
MTLFDFEAHGQNGKGKTGLGIHVFLSLNNFGSLCFTDVKLAPSEAAGYP